MEIDEGLDCISEPSNRSGRNVDVDIDVNAFLVDETSSDDSDEIAVFDSRDLSLLSDERKTLCEERMRNLYKTLRYNGSEYKTRRNIYGFLTLDTDFFDHIQETITVDFNEEKIAEAVIVFHVNKMGIKDGAAKMAVSVFDFIVLLMDYIWKERDKTVENYSISRIAGYLGVDRAHMLILGNLINNDIALAPSEIAVKTLSEPIELIVMLTMLLAQMYGWPVAEDFNMKWKSIETSSIASDEEAMQSMDDFVAIAREVLEDFKNDQSSPLCRHINDDCINDLVMISSELTKYASNLLNELRNLSSPNESISQGNILTQDRINQAEILVNEHCANMTEKSVIDSQKNDQKFSAITSEEVSVVNVTHNEHIERNYVIISDPVNISDIPNGSFCLARQQKAYNFVRCQIVEKVSPREYNVLFGDGYEEIIDISRIARKIEGHLHMWEGVRVCALYEPKLQFGRYRKAFYSGIVGVGPHGFSRNEMLIFFDNGIDSFVHERTVYILAEQKCRLHNYKEEIDRRNNWCLVPQFRQKFVKHYLKNFPDWPLVPMKRKENTQRVNILREGRPHSAYVLRTERQFALLRFPIRGRFGADCVVTPCIRHRHIDEWIYRGSERLEAIRQTIDRLEKVEQQEKMGVKVPVRSRREARLAHSLGYKFSLPGQNISDTNLSKKVELCPRGRALLSDSEQIYIRRQTARKGGILGVQHENDFQDYSVIEGRVPRLRKEKNLFVQDIPEWNNLQQVVHSHCTIRCLQCLDKDPYDKEFGGCSPYMIPLLVGWSREIVTFTRRAKVAHSRKATGSAVVYRTPCGISIYNLNQITKYLKDTSSRLTIDLFTFDRTIRPNIIYRTPVKAKLVDDFTNGYEAIPISVYNEIDDELPPKVEYDPRRYPYDKETDISSISLDFCSGCTCTDDCADETRCECRLLTRSEVLRLDKSLQPSFAKGYMYRNLALGGADESYLSGLYECNEKCGCSRSNCHNRVVQQEMKIPLELFKTEKMGWGVRSMIDIPPGVFLCTYAGAILTDSQAEKEGKAFGDEYFADVNLVDNVEKEKHNAGVDLGDSNDGYYSDDENNCGGGPNLSLESGLITTDEDSSEEDDDYDSGQDSSFSSEGNHSETRTVKTQKRRKLMQEGDEEQQNSSIRESEKNELAAADLDYARSSLVMAESDFAGGTKSDNDDMPAVEPAGPPEGRFDMIRYVENMELPSLYTIDAKKKGNIGRFFNHSCQPNIRAQLVYVDTHDFRLPWIAFFTTTKISAGSELFWDYGYSEGTVDGKQLECFCGSRTCRKRLL
ncbi:pre-SET domain-containing protein family protein [Loa loa]|uniref:Pre-SET domain-containing protein family protein n=1 Tax=Loa loa TaxID=7209 RepID=A0A1S0UHE2_LOALO|nr:pre-SET domain-containing protein family protein [Loa loa]EJD74846.1 pre-SET domain-containing protein family protein [Loa loa]